jgi:hypothetical protein
MTETGSYPDCPLCPFVEPKAAFPQPAQLQPFASTPITIIFMRRADIIFAKPE